MSGSEDGYEKDEYIEEPPGQADDDQPVCVEVPGDDFECEKVIHDGGSFDPIRLLVLADGYTEDEKADFYEKFREFY